ncbi:hypothetical protein [Pontiella sulfatireligans]|uniref:Uncharacterized protein n=1 Tax=Pontiella sulfatireligans TaxID=2750658 RepID=A0A6C2UKD5_9BACT|nr:hypothetical protein [Pontiella sulfatireligans]VGO19774.1 hypothetical protein SCARR_01833 [Pontiella sulfatireligans]
MNIKWTAMSGLGPGAWERDDQPLFIPSMHYHSQEHKTGAAKPAEPQPPSSVPERDDRSPD